MPHRKLLALVSASLWICVAASSCHDPVPPPPPVCLYECAATEAELIGALKNAYQKRDYDTFKRLFRPDYQFFLNAPQPDGTDRWDLTQELRIHNRMFNPQDVQPPDAVVPSALWLVSVDITLVPRAPFQDAADSYFDPVTNPAGFHRENFSVTQTDYVGAVFFQTAGVIQYRVDGAQNFVVVNDLSKAAGEDGKFLLYRWVDLGAYTSSAKQASTWSQVKTLYE